MKTRSALTCASIALLVSACSGDAPPSETSVSEAETSAAVTAPRKSEAARLSIPETFDCLRENGGVAIAAHRGGPYPGFPENAIETMQHGYDNGVRIFEIDIAESSDGTMFLMHDRTLTRTTTGDGFVAEKSWDEISDFNLIDNEGHETGFKAPLLKDVLAWAVKTGAIIELDKKPTTSFKNIIEQVRAAKAENNIIMISYNDDQAAEIAKLAPDLMMTATAYGDRDIEKLTDLGVLRDRLIAWTGTDTPKPDAWKRVLNEGVEPAFGTLGRKGERLDDLFLSDGDGSEYQTLVDQGLIMIATDAPLEAAAAINGDEIAATKCGL